VTRPVDERLVHERARRVATQVTGLVGLAMLVIVGLATVIVVRGQQAATDRLLRNTASTADDVGDPPPGAWIVLARAGRVQASPGLPEELVLPLAARRAKPAGLSTVRLDDASYRLLTRHRETGVVVQVAADLRPQHEERDRLLQTMGGAAVVSLLVAASLGALIGRRAVRPLAEALALQRGFVADASHELRTPLTLLSTRTQLLERSLPVGASGQVRDDVRGVVEDVQRLAEVVEDLLVAASPDDVDNRAEVDLRALVGKAVDSARAHAAAVQVELRMDSPVEAVPVVVSAPAIRRAVLSLVDNAVDHTPPEGTVTVSVAQRRGEATVRVADTGTGLTPEAAARVFERFHSGGHRAGRAHYGLGLALTHDVVLRHGGRLSLVPSESGAVFEITLPS
jgi:two-component system OmpR family sensor kinase